MIPIESDDIISNVLRDFAEKLEEKLKGEVFILCFPITSGLDAKAKMVIEYLKSQKKCKDKLIVILETDGGSIDVVERISDVFRHHFQYVDFIIPSHAFSAGTVLALSGDEIYMDYYSILSPIDPQTQKGNRLLPGLGYLEEYQDLIDKSKKEPLSTAEMQILLNKFDPAELFQLKREKERSIELIGKWLCAYKFKDWETHETGKKEVTKEYKENRAKEIAKKLGDPKIWKSHSRGIPMKTLTSDEIKLKIIDFGKDKELNDTIQQYYGLFTDYCQKIGIVYSIHTKYGLLPLLRR